MPAFMIVENIRELAETFRGGTVSPEAVGLAFMSLVLGFDRGKPYADDESEARAVHVQPRRLRRVKIGAPDLFRLFEGIGAKARQRLECRGKSEEIFRSRPKTAAKSTPPEQKEDIPMSPQERSHRESPPDVREDAPAAAPASAPPQSRKRPGTGKKRPKPRPAKRRAWPPKAATSPLADDWMPTPAGIAYAHSKGLTDADISRELDRFANHHRAKGSRFADWHAGWRGWIDRVDDFKPRGRREPQNLAAAFAAGCMSGAGYRASFQ